MREFAAIVLAMLSSSLYGGASALQALEARRVPTTDALRSSLIVRLVRRPLWLAGGAAGVLGWVCSAAALALASVALVQPALGLGLIVLLFLATRILGERGGPVEIGGSVAIVVAVAALAWAGPTGSTSFTTGGTWAIAVGLALIVGAPFALRAAGRAGGLATSIAGGLGWAAVGLATALVVDALDQRRWLVCIAWAIGVGLASWSSLISEMSALQFWPATRSIPVVFSLEMAVPAALTPLLAADSSPPHPVVFSVALVVACAGAVLVGRSRGVANQMAGAETKAADATGIP